MDKHREKRISKALSWLLRHGGMKEGIQFRSDAYAKANDVLEFENLKNQGVTFDDLQYIVDNNEKKRFMMIKEEDIWYVKATQGHSMNFEDISLKPITSIDQISEAIHGTYKRFLKSIMDEGLKSMSRTHIHFSIGVPGSDKVVSGMRTDCQILIYLDIQKCLDDKIELYLSENNVVLTKGNDGVLDSKYFLKVIDLKTGKAIS